MKNNKFKIIVFVTLAIALVLSGCGNGNSGSSSGDGKTIRFATWDSEESLALQQEIVDKFNSSHDDINVVLEAYGDEYDTKIAAGMGAKDAPDVMYMWNYAQYKDGLEVLDSYIEEEGEEFKDNYYEALLNYNSMDGKILGLPVGYTTHVLYYNKDLFDAAGVEYPNSDWTWEDLEEAAKKLTNKKENVSGFAFSGTPDPYDFEMYLWSNGAKYSDEDGNLKGNLNSKESIETFNMFQNMLKEGHAIATEGSGFTEMKSGKVAMFINGSWSIDGLKEAGINFGLQELPKFEGGEKVSIVSSSGLSMSKDSDNKEAAFEFIKYWFGEEGNKARLGYELPVLKSVVEEENIEEDELKSVFYSMLEKSEDYTPSSYIVEDWSQVSEDLSLVFEQIFNPSTLMDPEKVLTDTVE